MNRVKPDNTLYKNAVIHQVILVDNVIQCVLLLDSIHAVMHQVISVDNFIQCVLWFESMHAVIHQVISVDNFIQCVLWFDSIHVIDEQHISSFIFSIKMDSKKYYFKTYKTIKI
jgi:hypothetical protein